MEDRPRLRDLFIEGYRGWFLGMVLFAGAAGAALTLVVIVGALVLAVVWLTRP